jgi:hypothetical protein
MREPAEVQAVLYQRPGADRAGGGLTVWTYNASDQSPAAVAAVFAAKEFDPPRELKMAWGYRVRPGRWVGAFEIKGDARPYRLTGEGTLWTVELVEG